MSDISAVTKYFATANEGFITTTSGAIAENATTVPLTSVAGLVDGSVFVGIIDPGDATKQQVFTGTVSVAGSSITGVVWTRGASPTGHAGGASVVDYTTGTAFNMMKEGFLKQHTQTGTHSAITGESLSLSGGATVAGGLTVSGGAVNLPAGSVDRAELEKPHYGKLYYSTGGDGGGQVIAAQTEVGMAFDTLDPNSYGITAGTRSTLKIARTGWYQVTMQAIMSDGAGGDNAFIAWLWYANPANTGTAPDNRFRHANVHFHGGIGNTWTHTMYLEAGARVGMDAWNFNQVRLACDGVTPATEINRREFGPYIAVTEIR